MCTCVQKDKKHLGSGNYEYTFECTKPDGSKTTVKVTTGNDNQAKQLAELECDDSKLLVEYITESGYKTEVLDFEDANSEDDYEDFLWEENDETLKANSAFFSIESTLEALGTECKKFTIASIGGWPETKTEWKNRCVKIPFNGKACTKLPKVYRRTCKKKVFAQICYPSNFENSIKNHIEECAKGAATAAVAAAIATGASGALPVFKAAFEGCLAAKIGNKIDQVKFSVKSEKSCSSWKGI